MTMPAVPSGARKVLALATTYSNGLVCCTMVTGIGWVVGASAGSAGFTGLGTSTVGIVGSSAAGAVVLCVVAAVVGVVTCLIVFSTLPITPSPGLGSHASFSLMFPAYWGNCSAMWYAWNPTTHPITTTNANDAITTESTAGTR